MNDGTLFAPYQSIANMLNPRRGAVESVDFLMIIDMGLCPRFTTFKILSWSRTDLVAKKYSGSANQSLSLL